MSETPLISVIMSVYNSEAHLRESVSSILGQGFDDFEFIIINDGSSDGTAGILEEFAESDPRIILVHQENTGLTRALNKGLVMAKGKYIARQDADDVSYPERFEKQVGMLEKNPDIVLIGGGSDDVYEDGSTGCWRVYDGPELQDVVFHQTPFPHSTVMMRAAVCKKLGGYDESFKTAQDMELWMRFAKEGRIAVVPEAVIRRSVHKGAISHKRRWRQFYDGLRARWRHNPKARVSALYRSLRSLFISCLPLGFVKLLWKL